MDHSAELRVPEELYETRLKRFKRLIELNAPRSVLCAEAELFLRCFKWSWRGWWGSWRFRHFPNWLMWLTSREFRNAAREAESENDFMEQL